MLQLKNIVKDYGSGDTKVRALNGVEITFRENEFVAILGHSGCGKTTLLNIIGGLDHYTSGDLIINGVSTKKYKDRDWDAYRNHSIGFIFQSYNLIPHQTVLSNVELALTISGVSKSERRKRAKEALEKVGLGDQLHKKPNQMSGGQMQRVAIARALINNPDILLADEPTGALDSETSIQVMELLKEIAKDKLVIMVTHNPELAEQYATRIVRIKDGQLTGDSDPFTPEKADEPVKGKKKRVSMSFLTAVSLSLNNLMTKKGRTLLTAFAGSIGIIGIALILSLSTGINEYIDHVQEETLSSYPITINRESTDTSELFKTMFGGTDPVEHDPSDSPETVYAGTEMYDMFNNMNSSAKQINNMAKFKKFVDSNAVIKEKSNAVSYGYDVQMTVFSKDENGIIVKSDLNEIYAKAMGMEDYMSENSLMSSHSSSMMSMWNVDVWEELLPSDDGKDLNPLIYEQYDLVKGSWPKNYDEAVVVLDENNEIPDMITYTLGLKSADGFGDIIKAAMRGEEIKDYGVTKWSFSDIMNKDYKLILPCEFYERSSNGRGGYTDLSRSQSGLELLFNNDNIGIKLKIVGFIRPNPDTKVKMINGYIGYTKALTDRIIEITASSDIVMDQVNDHENDLINGKKFRTDDYVGPTDAEKIASAKEYIDTLETASRADIAKFVLSKPSEKELDDMVKEAMKPENRKKLFSDMKDLAVHGGAGAKESEAVVKALEGLSDEQFNQLAPDILRNILPFKYAADKAGELAQYTDNELSDKLGSMNITDEVYISIFDTYIPEEISDLTYDDVIFKLGYADPEDPSKIRIYAKSFSDKDDIADEIEKYNDSCDDEADIIHYTDFVKLLMSSVTNIITGISYLLIAFVGISLVVSSIMIGIITYISVLERTREIGILRAIGASKHDVSTVFNAETLLVGLCAGLIGIGVSVLLTIPINMVIHSVTNLDTLRAHVPVVAAIILIGISMFLTFIAGLIPSRVAAKKDPVVALRTE
ncbi:MAG: ABC transporter ATP-binding protein/permease [Ruminococcus sp.]|nr:ABC transporter ATP-binding protein/permease [Ruminococcus sp.]